MLSKQKIIDIFKKALTSGITPQKLTYSFCIGIYIAFSPYPGLHTLLMFIFSFLFGLHFPTVFLATSFNNPWTIVPFYSCDYAFGHWLLHSALKIHPTWSITLSKLFGSGTICVWSFLVGGNILGVLAAIAAYPLARLLFNRIAQASNT
jgi:uncharacterized protein